jgi:ferritin-like metal-binding protein YciE
VNELFRTELDTLLELERRLLDEVLPGLRDRAHAVNVRAALDRHLLETEEHVANLERVSALARAHDADEIEDLAILAEVLRAEHLELARYTFLVQTARALGVDEEAIRLLRLNMEQDDYAREQAEHALAKLLAEKVTARR